MAATLAKIVLNANNTDVQCNLELEEGRIIKQTEEKDC